MYANSHKPSWKTSKHHLVMGKSKKELFKDPKSAAGAIKGDFEHERMFGMVAKIPIANTANELVEMDFCGLWRFLHIPEHSGRFSRPPAIIFLGAKRRKNNRLKLFGGS